MATSTLLFLLLAVLVFESTTSSAVKDPSGPSDTKDQKEHINRIQKQDYSTQTAPGVCQLSTCEFLKGLGSTEQKLAHMELKMRNMEEEMKTTRERLQASKDQVQELNTKVAIMEGKLQTRQSEIEQLKSKDGVQVAFSAFLGGHGHVGPYDAAKTLEYQNVITNIGNAYKPATGHFIAPVKGVYYFYICYHGGQKMNTRIILHKNDQLVASASHAGHSDNTLNENGSNGVTLVLEPQDQVYVVLGAGSWVWDGVNQDTIFTGFLVRQL